MPYQVLAELSLGFAGPVSQGPGGGVQGHDGDWEKYFDKKTAVPPLSVNAHMGHRSFSIFSLEQ